LKIGPNLFSSALQTKIIFNFVKFFFSPLSCCCFWIRFPGSGIRNTGALLID
jgi:hypothetical protein